MAPAIKPAAEALLAAVALMPDVEQLLRTLPDDPLGTLAQAVGTPAIEPFDGLPPPFPGAGPLQSPERVAALLATRWYELTIRPAARSKWTVAVVHHTGEHAGRAVMLSDLTRAKAAEFIAAVADIEPPKKGTK